MRPQGTWVWGGCSASACAQSSSGGLRAAETFPSKAGCDTRGPRYLYPRVQPAGGGLRFAPCFVWGGDTGGSYMSQAAKPCVCASPWGLTGTQVWPDITTL